jgi:hypothetical protein
MARKPAKTTVKTKTPVKKAFKPTVERKQWEYETYSVPLENDVPDFHKALNDLGEKGWELVGILPKEDSEVLIFKRPRGWE